MGRKSKNSRKNMKPFDFSNENNIVVSSRGWSANDNGKPVSFTEIQEAQQLESNREMEEREQNEKKMQNEKEEKKQQAIKRWNESMMKMNEFHSSDKFKPTDEGGHALKWAVTHEMQVGREVQTKMFLNKNCEHLMFLPEVQDAIRYYNYSPMSIWDIPCLCEHKAEAMKLYKELGGYHYAK